MILITDGHKPTISVIVCRGTEIPPARIEIEAQADGRAQQHESRHGVYHVAEAGERSHDAAEKVAEGIAQYVDAVKLLEHVDAICSLI